MRDAGYQVSVAHSFSEAKRLIPATKPDLVITDVRLGPFNGLQLLWQRFFTDPRQASIAIDETEDPVTRREAERVGADYLVREQLGGELKARVEQRLCCDGAERPYGMRRRWTRHQFVDDQPLLLGDLRARLCDASYGGCRLEAPGAARMASGDGFLFTDSSWPTPLRAQVTWLRESTSGVEFGAALVETDFATLSVWKSSVDRWSGGLRRLHASR